MKNTLQASFESTWQSGLPTLTGATIRIREVRSTDAPALFAHLATEEVARFISPPPPNIEIFERFIAWAIAQREAGTNVCFVVALPDDTAIGLFQVRALEPDFGIAEWGFAMGSPYWGSGIFMESATLVLNFTFDVLGVHRLEARSAVQNARGNGALRKLRAVQEGVLRCSLRRNGTYLDQLLWTLLDSDWVAQHGFYSPVRPSMGGEAFSVQAIEQRLSPSQASPAVC